jgi:hypothetical protein
MMQVKIPNRGLLTNDFSESNMNVVTMIHIAEHEIIDVIKIFPMISSLSFK